MTNAKSQKRKNRLSTEERNEFGQRLIDDCHNGTFEDGKISMAEATKRYDVSTILMQEIYINAIEKGLTGFTFDYDQKKSTTSEHPYINDRSMIIMGKGTIEKLNEEAPEDQQFVKGDKFEVSYHPGSIVLTRIQQ